MNNKEYKDQGLRQALQRRNETAERKTLSEDFSDRLMERIGELEQRPKSKSRTWLYTLIGAAAASVVLLLTLHYINNHEVMNVERPMVVKQTEQHRSEPKAMEKKEISMAKEEKTIIAKTTMVNTRQKASMTDNKTSTAIPAIDSLDYYIDKIERELVQVDESLYIERMNKVIRADERLQRMVNSYILHTLDKEGRPQTAANMYNINTEQNEE